MEYLAVVRLRAIADTAQTQAQGDTPSTDASLGVTPTPPKKSKGVKGPILLCVHLAYHGHNRRIVMQVRRSPWDRKDISRTIYRKGFGKAVPADITRRRSG